MVIECQGLICVPDLRSEMVFMTNRTVCSTNFAVGPYGSPGASNSIEQYPRLGDAPSGSGGPEGFRAVGAGADAAEMFVTVDARSVAVAERDLNRVIAYLRGRLRARLGLKHRQSCCGGRGPPAKVLFLIRSSLQVAQG